MEKKMDELRSQNKWDLPKVLFGRQVVSFLDLHCLKLAKCKAPPITKSIYLNIWY